jgi:hypothetical protein
MYRHVVVSIRLCGSLTLRVFVVFSRLFPRVSRVPGLIRVHLLWLQSNFRSAVALSSSVHGFVSHQNLLTPVLNTRTLHWLSEEVSHAHHLDSSLRHLKPVAASLPVLASAVACLIFAFLHCLHRAFVVAPPDDAASHPYSVVFRAVSCAGAA